MSALPPITDVGRQRTLGGASKSEPPNSFPSCAFTRQPKAPGGLVMRKVSEYELRAVECRRLASQMKNPEQQLEEMAHAWELLARARIKNLQRGWNEPPQVK